MDNTTGHDAAAAARGVGIEQGRKILGDLVDRAYHHGVTTYLTRHDRRVAAIVPIDRVGRVPTRRGTARWDAHTRTITVTPQYSNPGERGSFVFDYDRPIDAYLTNALAREGWTVNPDDIRRFTGGETVAVVHTPHPPRQAEQLTDWITRYGNQPATVRGIADGRIRYLLIDYTTVLEGDAVVLETVDPNGALYERAAWPGVGGTLADLINGTQRAPDGDDGGSTT